MRVPLLILGIIFILYGMFSFFWKDKILDLGRIFKFWTDWKNIKLKKIFKIILRILIVSFGVYLVIKGIFSPDNKGFW